MPQGSDDWAERQYVERREQELLQVTREDYQDNPELAVTERDRRVQAELRCRDIEHEKQALETQRDALRVDNIRLHERARNAQTQSVLGGIFLSFGIGFITSASSVMTFNVLAGSVFVVAGVAEYIIAYGRSESEGGNGDVSYH